MSTSDPRFTKLPPPMELPSVESLSEFKAILEKYDLTSDQVRLVISHYITNQALDFARASKTLSPEEVPSIFGEALSACIFGLIRVLQDRDLRPDLISQVATEKVYQVFSEVITDLQASTGVKIYPPKKDIH